MKKSKLGRYQAMMGYLFISPTLLLFLAFTVIPIIMAFYLSFTNYDVFSPIKLVGLENYRRLLKDDLLWLTFKNVFYYVIMYVPTQLIISLFLAILLNRAAKSAAVFRALTYLPTLTSAVAASTIWLWMLHPEFGLINQLLEKVGIVGPAWLAQTNTAMISVVAVTLWQSVGSNMIIYLAGLQGIPDFLYESAMLDGAGWWARFWHVTIPGLRPTTFFVSTMSIIGSLQIFDQAYVLTQGGPANATKTPVYHIYMQGFGQLQMGYASAMAFVLALAILIVSIINMRINKEGALI